MIGRKSIATAGVVAALAVGVLVPAAFAQDATESEQPDTSIDDRHAEHHAALAEALAEELGLDADTVAAALEEVSATMAEERAAEHRAQLEERLDAAVAEGALTEEQADALRAAQEADVLRGWGGRGGHRHHGGPGGMFGVDRGYPAPLGDEVPGGTSTSV